MTVRVLTGINTTGTLHLGNYCGAIRPCIQASHRADVESFFFMADLHALIKCQDADRIEKSRMQIAAAWLACGLDPNRVTFYRQSDIPEIPLLNWMFNCVCAKGLMNRAHAYKAVLEANEQSDVDPDSGVSLGLFCYPRLLAARKMSKSYNNVIPLFEGGKKALVEAISRIVTDSKLPGEPKDPSSTSLTQIFDAFATETEQKAFRTELEAGLGWGEAKKRLVEQIEKEIGPMREKYAYYTSHPAQLEEILLAGAAKARKISVPFMEELRRAVGLRKFHALDGSTAAKKTAKKAAKPVFKQYRESDGQFYFKFVDPAGKILLQSKAFALGKEAGQTVGRLKAGWSDEFTNCVTLGQGVTLEEVHSALAAMKEDE